MMRDILLTVFAFIFGQSFFFFVCKLNRFLLIFGPFDIRHLCFSSEASKLIVARIKTT